jgi:hypothetical protein
MCIVINRNILVARFVIAICHVAILARKSVIYQVAASNLSKTRWQMAAGKSVASNVNYVSIDAWSFAIPIGIALKIHAKLRLEYIANVATDMLILFVNHYLRETQLNAIMIAGRIKERRNLLWHLAIRVNLRLIEIASILNTILRRYSNSLSSFLSLSRSVKLSSLILYLIKE